MRLILISLFMGSVTASLIGMDQHREEYRIRRNTVLYKEMGIVLGDDEKKDALLRQHQQFIQWESGALKEHSLVGFCISALASCFIPLNAFYEGAPLNDCTHYAGIAIACTTISIVAGKSACEWYEGRRNAQHSKELQRLIALGEVTHPQPLKAVSRNSHIE